mgnify:CR=1 FL=1
MAQAQAQHTPMMQQYLALKAEAAEKRAEWEADQNRQTQVAQRHPDASLLRSLRNRVEASHEKRDDNEHGHDCGKRSSRRGFSSCGIREQRLEIVHVALPKGCTAEDRTRHGLGLETVENAALDLDVAAEAPEGSVILAMLPDTDERYLSTPLFEDVPQGSDDEWLETL